MRILVYVLLAAILASLFSALLLLVRDRGGGERMLKALTWRIGLSLALFMVLMASHYLFPTLRL
jgi:hypothetical protein